MSGKTSPIAVTKSERLLSWILAGFVLLALSWAYVNVDDRVREMRRDGLREAGAELKQLEKAERVVARSLGLYGSVAYERIYRAEERLYVAQQSRDTARERYRTKLDEGDKDDRLRRAYLRADARADRLRSDLTQLRAQNSAATKKLNEFRGQHRDETRSAKEQIHSYGEATNRIIFLLRLLLSLGILLLSVWLLRAVTERSPRAQPLAQAGVIASSLMLLTLIIDYSEISFDFDSVGPLGMALLGMIITVGAFFGLQRYLRNRRPNRRLRSGECAACGYPGGTDYCENCGQQLTAKCGECGESRRIGTGHCRACGAA